MTDLALFRTYEPHELGKDGYPVAWHETVKHAVREEAGHRCVRCGHPYRRGEHGRGEWSPCDPQCSHAGLIRLDGGEPFVLDDDTAGAIALPPGPRVEAAWRILTVHHLNGRKHDLRWWNLIACCQRCHLWLQGTVQMERVYPFEHDEYFKPYAAGWYAYAYLGENLTREETLERMDELLALELAA